MKIHMALVALIVLILASCATTNSLPSSSAEVDEFKKTEWPRKSALNALS